MTVGRPIAWWARKKEETRNRWRTKRGRRSREKWSVSTSTLAAFLNSAHSVILASFLFFSFTFTWRTISRNNQVISRLKKNNTCGDYFWMMDSWYNWRKDNNQINKDISVGVNKIDVSLSVLFLEIVYYPNKGGQGSSFKVLQQYKYHF